MKLLDTNVLLRWLLQDDREQARAADRFLRRALRDGERLLVSDLAFAEMAWVLGGQGLSPAVIANSLRGILDETRIEFENRERLLAALTLYEAHGVDFIDAYHAGAVQEMRLEGVVSFDRDFDRLPVPRMEP